MTEQSIKIYQFKLSAGTEEQRFLEASKQLDIVLKTQPGFLYRSLAKQSDGQWQDIIYWESADLAAEMGKNFDSTDLGQQFMALIDVASVQTMESSIVTTTCMAEESEAAA